MWFYLDKNFKKYISYDNHHGKLVFPNKNYKRVGFLNQVCLIRRAYICMSILLHMILFNFGNKCKCFVVDRYFCIVLRYNKILQYYNKTFIGIKQFKMHSQIYQHHEIAQLFSTANINSVRQQGVWGKGEIYISYKKGGNEDMDIVILKNSNSQQLKSISVQNRV